MPDSIATPAKTESVQPNFSHGLLEFCTREEIAIAIFLPPLLTLRESLKRGAGCMATKAYRRFVQRVEYYSGDIELCDLLVRKFTNTSDTRRSVALELGSTDTRHPHLGRRRNNNQSRKIIGSHLKRTLYAAFNKDLFEDFSAFLSDTMTKAAMKGINPARFVGDVKLDLHAADLLAAGSWEAIVNLISNAIFRKLENERNTKDLIDKASIRIGLQLNNQTVDAAMPYLDARHILVHRDGETDEKYRRDYPGGSLKDKRIAVDYRFVADAKRAVMALASHIDERIIAAGLARQEDMSGFR